MSNAIFCINAERNGIEITFTDKPGEVIRSELKAAGFRWHRARKIWYAKQNAERLELAERLTNGGPESNEDAERKTEEAKATSEASSFSVPPVEFVDGGGLYDGWQGGHAGEWHDEKELKKLLLSDFKRAGISATVRFRRGGYTTALTVTIKLSASDVRTFDDWAERFHISANCWYGYEDEETGRVESISGSALWGMDYDERAALLKRIKPYQYKMEAERLTDSGTSHHKEAVDVLTDEGNAKYKTARAIVDSYNSDCSNSMIDYFDRAIYDHYAFKIS